MKTAPATSRDKIVAAGIELFRTSGFVGTSVDDICRQAGITKGAFFHHFDSKEALAETCLLRWDAQTAAMEQAAPFQTEADPVKRLLGSMDFYIQLFANPKVRKACLAGAAAQEVAETNPTLRAAAGACFAHNLTRFQQRLDDAAQAQRKRLDTVSLAQLWLAAIQGSLLLCKTNGDSAAVTGSLSHVKQYIAGLLEAGPARPPRDSRAKKHLPRSSSPRNRRT